MTSDAVDYVRDQARRRPDAPALTIAVARGSDQDISWGRLVEEAEAVAAGLREAGAASDGRMVLGLGTGSAHLAYTLGGWMAGQRVLPVPPDLPPAQLQLVADRFRPHLVVDRAGTTTRTSVAGDPAANRPRPPARSAILSSGTTGDPKVILRRTPWSQERRDLGRFEALCRPGDVTLVSTPLHGMGFQTTWDSLLADNRTVLLDRFTPSAWLRAVERYGVTFARVVPTQMKWLAESPDFAAARLGTLRAVHHTAAACPPDVKRAWIARVSADAVYESYSSREDVLSTLITGPEWLAHPGSVGRVDRHSVRILDEDGREVPTGTVGRIFLRPHDARPVVEGEDAHAALPRTPDGKFVGLGDLGRLDGDGYLYLVDRVDEVFTTGGVNVFPQQVEQELLACPGVRDGIVLGEAHPDLGHVAVALVVLADGTDLEQVRRFCAGRLSGPHRPAEYRQVDAIPRDTSGKIRRAALREAAAQTPAAAGAGPEERA
jgi:bile acid-coenzyme A ligase